jgi:PAS domain S-box-containing protein
VTDPKPPSPQRPSSTRATSLVGVLSALPAIVWEADGIDYVMTFVSPRARDLLGHDPEAWVAAPTFWEGHLHPDDRARAVRDVEDALQARAGGSVEYRFRHADGTYRWFRDTFSVIEDEGGSLRLTGLMLDVSDERAAREAQERAEIERDRLIEAVEQSAESISITDADHRLVYVNAGFERNTGFRREEVLGRTRAFLMSSGADPSVHDRIRELVEAQGTWAGEVLTRRKDGSRYREALSISVIRDGAGRITGSVAAGRDITREREVEAQLAQAARMEAIGQLAGGIAHDFNNLLTAILGYGSMLGDSLAAGGSQAADLNEMLAAARRAQSLTSQLLAFGRRALLQPRTVQPAALVRGLAPMMERLIGEDVTLKVTVRSEGCVRIDPGQFEQAVVNLVVNARDAMPAGGTVVVTVRPPDQAERPAAAEDATGGDADDSRAWVVVEVSDSGMGMTEEVRAHAFDPFFTTKPVGQGTGLGLAMVEGFIRQSGGSVAVVTAPGAGTTIALLLPRVDEEVEGAVGDEVRPALAAGLVTALVVEDEPAIRRLAARTLRAAGHTVLEAATGESALAIADTHQGRIDVLFTDVVMPGLSGPSLADELVRRRPGIRVVLTSGYTESEVARRGLAVMPGGFLRKPYAPSELLAALRPPS